MTPANRALEITQKMGMTTFDTEFNEGRTLSLEVAKQCALIAVEEIIEALESFAYSNNTYDDFETGKTKYTDTSNPCEYWNKVKEEIQSL